MCVVLRWVVFDVISFQTVDMPWSEKKNTIKVYFVLSDGETDVENAPENMQLAFHVRDAVLFIRFRFSFVLKNVHLHIGA